MNISKKKPNKTLRAFLLYYLKDNAGQPLMWQTISMGAVSNCREIFSDKKKSIEVWENSSPEKFKIMDTYLPHTWGDIDSFESEMNPDKLYVYKPVMGTGGGGIVFKKGNMMKKFIEEQTKKGVPSSYWVIQEFVDPFLWNNRKTHMRSITLLIIQPSGEREFYIYNKMRLFTAAIDYNEKTLLDSEADNKFMLLTNMHQNMKLFRMNPNNKGKEFNSTDCIVDVQEALESNNNSLSFDHVFDETKGMHNTMYSIVGGLLECKGTKTSIYDHACFHIMGADIAFDKNGDLYFLEMNTAMHWDAWSNGERSGLFRGAAALIRGTDTPFDTSDTDVSMWMKLDV